MRRGRANNNASGAERRQQPQAARRRRGGEEQQEAAAEEEIVRRMSRNKTATQRRRWRARAGGRSVLLVLALCWAQRRPAGAQVVARAHPISSSSSTVRTYWLGNYWAIGRHHRRPPTHGVASSCCAVEGLDPLPAGRPSPFPRCLPGCTAAARILNLIADGRRRPAAISRCYQRGRDGAPRAPTRPLGSSDAELLDAPYSREKLSGPSQGTSHAASLQWRSCAHDGK